MKNVHELKKRSVHCSLLNWGKSIW